MANRLIDENSPYLLQHAENPVEWYPWGPEVLDKARSEDKPIFLSIGYAACHWCHVMAHESFEDPETAGIMNQFFVNIKVDREQRPDLDSIYMDAVVAMTGQGGWPMSVFLTPDGVPFFGGTYFPPERRYRMPSFREVLLTVARLWREDRGQLLESGEQIKNHLAEARRAPKDDKALDPKLMDQAAFRMVQAYDWQNGGWGAAPKFPQPMAIEFLLRRAAGGGDQLALDVAVHALESMARGGMYDVVGGGFARYSTDDDWLVPHFEKMLYDNAQLARVYLIGHLLTGRKDFRKVCERTLDFILRELADPQGGFYSSLDADSEGEEGKFYVWTQEELNEVLAAAQQRAPAALPTLNWVDFFTAAYGVKRGGNWEEKTVLQRAQRDAELAEQFGISDSQVDLLLDAMHAALLERRSQRVRPGTDDKVLASWNGLALIAFAEAARYLKRPDYLEAAQRNASFLISGLHPGDRLLRSWRKGQAAHNAYLEDYAALALGLFALYQSDGNPVWFAHAERLVKDMLAHFRDESSGFYDTRDDADPLLVRPRDVQDNATPSGSALAALALIELSAYTGHGELFDQAQSMVASLQDILSRYPTGFSKWLCAFYLLTNPMQEVAILASDEHDPEFDALIDALWTRFRPALVAALSTFPPAAGAPPLLADRPLLNGRATAYVCRQFVCQRPVTDPVDLSMQLDA